MFSVGLIPISSQTDGFLSQHQFNFQDGGSTNDETTGLLDGKTCEVIGRS